MINSLMDIISGQRPNSLISLLFTTEFIVSADKSVVFVPCSFSWAATVNFRFHGFLIKLPINI